MPPRKKITLQMIADDVGVTLQTVSKALLGKPGMSLETRRRIFETARRLGYRSKGQVNSLLIEHIMPVPTGGQRFLLLHSGASDNYKKLLINGLHQRFAEFGHHIEAVALPGRASQAQMARFIDEQDLSYAAGLFLAPNLSPVSWETALLKLTTPKILLGYPAPGSRVDSVVWDVYEAMWQSVQLLVRQGHRHILYVGDIESQPGFLLRWQAFLHAARTFGLPAEAEQHVIRRRDREKSWLQELEARLANERTTAIICGLDEETDLTYRLCSNLGIKLPRDMAMIGFLNETPASPVPYTVPFLPIQMTGYRAADRMLWRIANSHLPYEHIRIQWDFFGPK